MHSHNSTDGQFDVGALAQSMGGLYLAVAAALILALVLVDGMVVRSRLGHPVSAAATPPAKIATPPVEKAALYAKLAVLAGQLSSDAAERNRLAQQLDQLVALRKELGLQAGTAGAGTAAGQPADLRAALLANIAQVERELAAVSQALGASEQRIAANQLEIAGLGARLNQALLAKVVELQRGRSEFFARLRDVLGDRPGFKIEGDRFTLPSEVLFAAGSDRLLPQGLKEVRRLAGTINDVSSRLPAGIDWVLRVGGHTDDRPIATARFPSNWELSAMRAVTVVKALVAAGVPAQHLVAAGLGEFHPVAADDSPDGRARNRRIEFRLDQP